MKEVACKFSSMYANENNKAKRYYEPCFIINIVIFLTEALNLGTSKNHWRHFKLSALKYS